VNVSIEEQNVEIDGLPIRYLSAGEGPPLVLLHGAGDNALDWRLVMPTLAATHRVYAPDLPGSPDSAGLGYAINPAFTSVNFPGLAEAAIPFWRTPVGAYQRAWGRTALLFAHPPEAFRASGWQSSAGWLGRRATWKPT
jgi:pimeloyl-ACP methyl ester carboxylesterase